MKAVWNPAKNKANKAKHGLDFADFKGWDGEALTIRDDRYDYGEERWIDIGRIGGQPFVLVYTVVPPLVDDLGTVIDDEEMIRLISWRRIAEKDIANYDDA